MSARFFYNPSSETVVAPQVATVSSEVPARYLTVPWGELHARRAAGDSTGLGEEVQVGHDRTPVPPSLPARSVPLDNATPCDEATLSALGDGPPVGCSPPVVSFG